VSTDVSEEHIASIFKVKKISSAWYLLSRWFLAELIFLPEDGGDKFLRNVC
jgi:hypothetical protein